MGNFIIQDHPDGYKVTWPGYDKAFALLNVRGSRVFISDIFRDPAQEKGSAGKMLVEVFRRIGVNRPSQVRMVNVLENQPTIQQINRGVSPSETVLGKVILDLANALGCEITSWNHGYERGKFWIEGNFRA